MRLPCLVACALLLTCPANAQDERVTVRLSVDFQRICESVSHFKDVLPASEPEVEQTLTTFHTDRIADGYEFVESTVDKDGNRLMRAVVDETGAVRSASLSGSSVDVEVEEALGPIDIGVMAIAHATEVPERVLMGRSFAIGDEYYPPGLDAWLLEQFSSSMGMPEGFIATGTFNLPFQGEHTLETGERVFVWEGQMSIVGDGHYDGVHRVVSARLLARYEVDVATGLLRESSSTGAWIADTDGKREREARSSERQTCRILPRPGLGRA